MFGKGPEVSITGISAPVFRNNNIYALILGLLYRVAGSLAGCLSNGHVFVHYCWHHTRSSSFSQ